MKKIFYGFLLLALAAIFSQAYVQSSVESQSEQIISLINTSNTSEIADLISLDSQSVETRDVEVLIANLQQYEAFPLDCTKGIPDDTMSIFLNSVGSRYIEAQDGVNKSLVVRGVDTGCKTKEGVLGIKLRISFCDHVGKKPCGIEIFRIQFPKVNSN